MSPRFPHLPEDAWRAVLEDRASPETEARLDAHLDSCAECRDAFEAADPSRIFRRLRGLRVRPETFEGLWESIAAELPDRRPAADAEARARRSGSRALAAGMAAALAAAVLLRALAPSGGEGAADPCAPPRVALLRLTPDECRALHALPLDGPVEVIIDPSLDLRGL